jgi:hypothetical protein
MELKRTFPSQEGTGAFPKDIEKGREAVPFPSTTISSTEASSYAHTQSSIWQKLKQWNARFEAFTGLESRGIARVLPSERQPITPSSYLQIALLWISCDLTVNSITLAMLGPLVFELSFKDSALCAVFGVLIGCLGPAYTSTWGPRSGNRTMVSVTVNIQKKIDLPLSRFHSIHYFFIA